MEWTFHGVWRRLSGGASERHWLQIMLEYDHRAPWYIYSIVLTTKKQLSGSMIGISHRHWWVSELLTPHGLWRGKENGSLHIVMYTPMCFPSIPLDPDCVILCLTKPADLFLFMTLIKSSHLILDPHYVIFCFVEPADPFLFMTSIKWSRHIFYWSFLCLPGPWGRVSRIRNDSNHYISTMQGALNHVPDLCLHSRLPWLM